MHITQCYPEIRERIDNLIVKYESLDLKSFDSVSELLGIPKNCDDEINHLAEYFEIITNENIANHFWQIIKKSLETDEFIPMADLELHREAVHEKICIAIKNLYDLLLLLGICDPLIEGKSLSEERSDLKVEEKKRFLLTTLYKLRKSRVYWHPEIIFILNDISLDDEREAWQIARMLLKSKYIDEPTYGSGVRITAEGKAFVEEKLSSTIKENSKIKPLKNSNSMDIFISHSNHDKETAKLLLELIRSAFNISPKKIRCTSVEGYNLAGGASTDAQLRSEINDCKVLIGIITKASMTSTYVLFELGARWGMSKPLIPVIRLQEETMLLKGPLSGIHALNLSSAAQVHTLVATLEKELGKKSESPAVYHDKLDALMRFAEFSDI